jgi:hypothetical protein
MRAFTDYPIWELGDKFQAETGQGEAKTREVEILSYDLNKYCRVQVVGTDIEMDIKTGYLYRDAERLRSVKYWKLHHNGIPIWKLRRRWYTKTTFEVYLTPQSRYNERHTFDNRKDAIIFWLKQYRKSDCVVIVNQQSFHQGFSGLFLERHEDSPAHCWITQLDNRRTRSVCKSIASLEKKYF